MALSPVFNTVSASLPSPILLSAPTVSSSGPFATGVVYAASLNQVYTALGALAVSGAGQLGGILGECSFSSTGLVVTWLTGIVCAPFPTQVPGAGLSITIAASSTVYLFATFTGGNLGIASSTTTTPPSSSICYLGKIVSGASTITSLDQSGVIFYQASLPTRTTADVLAPTDSPGVFPVLTKTLNGAYLWTGTTHDTITSTHQEVRNTSAATLVSNLALTEQSPNYQWLISSGASFSVTLPDPSLMPIGGWFQIVNAGNTTNASQNYSIVVKDFSGSTIATLTCGQAIKAVVQPNQGSGLTAPVWPSSLTPTAPTY